MYKTSVPVRMSPYYNQDAVLSELSRVKADRIFLVSRERFDTFFASDDEQPTSLATSPQEANDSFDTASMNCSSVNCSLNLPDCFILHYSPQRLFRATISFDI